MASEWRTARLGELVSFQRGHDLTEGERSNGIIPVMGSAGRAGFHSTATSPAPGVILGRSGASMGRLHYCDEPYWAHNTVLYSTSFHGNEPRFVFYALHSVDFSAFNSGSAQPTLNRNFIINHPVRIPPLPEQRAIAHILGTLDDKIELNRQMSATLEAMARALFESWFVRFDPVRAKVEGRDTGLPADIAARFPDSFEQSEIGEVPKGWQVSPIGSVAECVGGSTPSTTEARFWDGGVHHWVTPKDMSSLSCRVLTGSERKITDAGVSAISSGILPAGTVLLSSRAPVGYLAISAIPVSVNQGFIALKASASAPSSFLLGWCESQLQAIKDRASGTTFPEISKAAFRPMPCVLPSAPVMTSFDSTSRSLTDRVGALVIETRTLTQLRDTLLPKLISGELRVPDAERAVASAGVS